MSLANQSLTPDLRPPERVMNGLLLILFDCDYRWRGEEGAEPKGEALDLPIDLRSHTHWWSGALSSDR